MSRLSFGLKRAREVLRQEGMWSLLKRLKNVLRQLVAPPWQCLYWKPLVSVSGEQDSTLFLRACSSLSDLNSEELVALEKSIGRSNLDLFSKRLAAECQLYILFKMKDVAGTLFTVLGTKQTFQHVVLTPADSAILDARIAPEFRGHGLYAVFLQLTLRMLNERGVERVFIATDEDNEPSVRAIRRVGFHYLLRFSSRFRRYRFNVEAL